MVGRQSAEIVRLLKPPKKRRFRFPKLDMEYHLSEKAVVDEVLDWLGVRGSEIRELAEDWPGELEMSLHGRRARMDLYDGHPAARLVEVDAVGDRPFPWKRAISLRVFKTGEVV